MCQTTWFNKKCTIKIYGVSEYIKNKKSSTHVYFSALTATLLMISSGSFMVWSSPMIPKLQSNDTQINPLGTPITTMEVSTLASVPYIAALFAHLIMAKISDRIGRKKMMTYTSISMVMTATVIAFGKNIYIYNIFWSILGVHLSAICLTVPVYITEIAANNNRSKLSCFVGLGVPCGILIGYIFGPNASVQNFTLICVIPAMMHFLLTHFFMVESPIYLASIGKRVETLKALEYLRGCNHLEDIEMEYNNIEEELKSINYNKKRSFLNLFKNRSTKKALIISELLCIGQQTSGISIILAFMAPIFNESDSTLSGDAVGVIIGSIKLSMYLVAAYTIEKVGRRSLMLFSSLTSSISILCLAFYFYLKNIEQSLIENIRWLPILSVIIFIIGYSFGLGPIPIGLISELFPSDLRSTGVAVVFIGDSIAIFLLNFSFPLLSEAFGVHSSMFINSMCCLVTFLIVYFLLPETKQKNLADIQNILNK